MICYVTAYLDLHRDAWPVHQRSLDTYLNSFLPLIPLVEEDPEAECLLFLDDTIEILQLKDTTSFTVIPINRQCLRDFPVWSTLETERAIMKDPDYRKLIHHRRTCPECWNPEYTLINHSKVDFMKEALSKTDAPYLCWVDFGYFALPDRIPKRLLDVSKLDCERVNYTLINPVQPVYTNLLHVLTRAPECIGGFFFFGPRQAIEDYHTLYCQVLHDFQHLYRIADDDQHLAMVCYFRQPNLFRLHHLRGWHRALTHFQKECSAGLQVAQHQSQ